ncbi:MAG: histidine phosphatase family protein [Woeseiaceae bacterium]|nr:histidine phosphatase family protein [Woeseiaceae bacterium]
MKRQALDGARRRRLYLFRHGAVDYVNPDGSWVPDPDLVSLNERGWEQARRMGEAFAGVAVDKAICSGLKRTRQTAETVLASHAIPLTVDPGLEEIRPGTFEETAGYDPLSDVAFLHWRASNPEARFLGGERYSAFYSRVSEAIDAIVMDHEWHNLAIVAHGGTNAAILGWVTGLGLEAFGMFDQETCCLNIIDFDTTPDGVVRKTVRAVNVTSIDPLKSDRHAGDMELLAKSIISLADV